MAIMPSTRPTLPDHFIVLVDKSNYEEVQNELIMLGYRWRMKAPPGKGTPETRSSKKVRHGPHAGINCYSRDYGKHLWMARVLSGSRIDVIQKRDGASILTAMEFLAKVREARGSLVNIDLETIEQRFIASPFFEEQSRFIMSMPRQMGKTNAIFNWRNPMTKKQRPWRFESRHAADIDFIKIASDLSSANPVALVRDINAKKDDQVWLVVHYKPLLKARLIDEQLGYDPAGRGIAREVISAVMDRGYPTRDHQAFVVRVSLGETKEIVTSLKDLKRLAWPKGEDKKVRTIEVTMPKV